MTFTASVDVSLTIASGERSGTATVTFTPTDDVVAESDETAQVSGTSEGFTITPATLTIEDNDDESNAIVLSASPASVGEDNGNVDIEVTATLSGGSLTEATEVSLAVVGVSATETEDYTTATGVSITIPAGQLTGSANLSVTLVDDGIHEGGRGDGDPGNQRQPRTPRNRHASVHHRR